ncbi:MAG TPA: GNAT family N-acetyltransferase [Gaiellaceae bacterium]|nr:GNAT family N-acetyltransferase [Gaiellaceae bacterium]
MELRRLGVGDEEVVIRLSLDDERQPHTVESARELLANDATYYLAAFENGEPIAQLLAYELIRRHGDGRMMLVYEIGVREEARRLGVGRALFDLLRKLCRERGVRRAFVITNESNEPAMAFYASLGATRASRDDVVLDLDWSR